MKHVISLLALIFLLFSCNDVDPPPEIEVVKAQSTAPLKTNNDSLTTEQIEKIKSFHTILKEVCALSLQELIDDLKKDPNANVEIDSWTRIASAYKKCINTWHYNPKLEMKKEIFQLILNRSMTTDEEAIKSVKPNLLSEREVEVVLNFYNAEPDPFDELGK